jgi:hypothetical protein
MQHRGVPTRLLDWTDGALIASHFAIRDKPPVAKSSSTVFVLDSDWLSDLLKTHPDQQDAKRRWKLYLDEKKPYDMDEEDWDRLYLPEDESDAAEPLPKTPVAPALWEPHHSTRRIAAQRSHFMIFATDPKWLANLEGKKNTRLPAITIPKDSVDGIRLELRDAGMTECMVYPYLDRLGRELKQLRKTRR